LQNIFVKKEYFVANPLLFEIKKLPEKTDSLISFKIITTAYNMNMCSRFFYFHILSIAKIWLNILMDDHHLSNITKMEKKKKNCINFSQCNLMGFLFMMSSYIFILIPRGGRLYVV